MQMKYRLPRVRADIRHHAIAAVQSARLRDFARRAQTFRNRNFFGVVVNFRDGFDMPIGNNQNVRRRARMQIGKRGHVVVLKDNVRRRAARDNFTKDTGHAQSSKRRVDY
ncbi:MAG: hypothetical protein HDKAJFGB_00129 [Anaerolineae bacterium]|nr:hypothetical protein [Anaerolineae bacterium]